MIHDHDHDDDDDDDDRPLVWTTKETARRLRVTEQHVRNLIGRGEMPSVLIGTRRLVPIRGLERWLEEHTQ